MGFVDGACEAAEREARNMQQRNHDDSFSFKQNSSEMLYVHF